MLFDASQAAADTPAVGDWQAITGGRLSPQYFPLSLCAEPHASGQKRFSASSRFSLEAYNYSVTEGYVCSPMKGLLWFPESLFMPQTFLPTASSPGASSM